MLGALFGLIGVTFALAGFQRWASIAAGAAILAGLLARTRGLGGNLITQLIAPTRGWLVRLLGHRTPAAAFAFGTLNGLLPCGLVYVAGAGAVAAGGVLPAVTFMFAFGLGTVPMLLGISLAGSLVNPRLRLRFQKMIPIGLAMLGVLLILRGVPLGIPYISGPDLAAGGHCPACR